MISPSRTVGSQPTTDTDDGPRVELKLSTNVKTSSQRIADNVHMNLTVFVVLNR